MKDYLYNYIKYIDDLLSCDKRVNYKKLKEDHLIKIKFFQHERLIHLLVTLFYALFSIIFIFLSIKFFVFLVITMVLLIFLIFYVVHYFRLENGVQYLYEQYDEIERRYNERRLFL
ncbi:MAG: hypothetical protein IKF19_01350 [Bacilli bacterium]|nr:hypothetical protein [Bacilli bacterium]